MRDFYVSSILRKKKKAFLSFVLEGGLVVMECDFIRKGCSRYWLCIWNGGNERPHSLSPEKSF